MRDESTENKNNPLLTRIELIQKEIDEVRNREREYRKIHANEFGDLVDFDDDHDTDDGVDGDEQQRDSLEDNGRSPEPNSSDGGLSSTPSTSNSTTDLSTSYQKPLDVTHRQSSLNSSVASIPTGRTGLVSPVSPTAAFQLHPQHPVSSPTPPQPQPRVFVPSQKGLMQKFIISHGKITSERNNGLNIKNGGIHHADYITSAAIELSEPTQRAPIERDEYGRPLRKGYIPVKDKIQQELQDLESREAELKVLRKSLSAELSQPAVNGSGNGPVVAAAATVVVQADVKSNCDKLTILQELNEVPSSTKLIEQWENLIKEQQRQKTL